jgi:hypothetical protein
MSLLRKPEDSEKAFDSGVFWFGTFCFYRERQLQSARRIFLSGITFHGREPYQHDCRAELKPIESNCLIASFRKEETNARVGI